MNYQSLDNDYLVKENRKLRVELKQAKKLKELHQEALMEMNQLYPESQIVSTLVQIINLTSNKSKFNEFNDIIMQLQAKVMVLQKIASQTEQNEKQMYNLLADEFQKLKDQNCKISDQLHKFYQKIGEVDYLSGLVTKYKYIITTTDQTMAFKKEQQQLLDALNLQQQTIQKITEQRNKLTKINIHMKKEVQKKKDQVRNMTMMLFAENDNFDSTDTNNLLDELNNDDQSSKNKNQSNIEPQKNIDQLQSPTSQRSNLSPNRFSKLNMSKMSSSIAGSNPNLTLNFIKLQRQLLKDVKQQDEMRSSQTGSSDFNCPQLSILFPDKVQKIIKTKQQAKVPYLNMKKVREMMARRQQKIRKQIEQQRHHINPTNKIIQLETQLQITRKQLASQTLKFRLMSDQIKDLRLKLDELEKRNQLLTESNFKLKNNYQIIFKDYQICKSISSEVERALGMVVKQENQQKVRQKLAVLLGTTMENIECEENKLETTFREQLRAKRLYKLFEFKNTDKGSRCRSI